MTLKNGIKNTKRLDAYVITLINDARSTALARECLRSINDVGCCLAPYILPATTPVTMEEHLFGMKEDDFGFEKGSFQDALQVNNPRSSNLQMNHSVKVGYPLVEKDNRLDLATGLQLNAYRAKNPLKIVACTISHMRAWAQACKTNRMIVVLEQDAWFIKKFKIGDLTQAADNDKTWGVMGINLPVAGHTRRAGDYLDAMNQHLQEHPKKLLMPPPTINRIGEAPVPQGLAGNSAYVIKPWAARELLTKTLELGIWPNDALMCKELFPWIRQIVHPFTSIQESTTSTTTG